MIADDLRQRRLEAISEHMDTEATQEFDRTLATFNGHPRYEIMPTGQVFDGDEEVMGYYRMTRTAFPTNATTMSATTSPMTRSSSSSTCWEPISVSFTACRRRGSRFGCRS